MTRSSRGCQSPRPRRPWRPNRRRHGVSRRRGSMGRPAHPWRAIRRPESECGWRPCHAGSVRDGGVVSVLERRARARPLRSARRRRRARQAQARKAAAAEVTAGRRPLASVVRRAAAVGARVQVRRRGVKESRRVQGRAQVGASPLPVASPGRLEVPRMPRR